MAITHLHIREALIVSGTLTSIVYLLYTMFDMPCYRPEMTKYFLAPPATLQLALLAFFNADMIFRVVSLHMDGSLCKGFAVSAVLVFSNSLLAMYTRKDVALLLIGYSIYGASMFPRALLWVNYLLGTEKPANAFSYPNSCVSMVTSTTSGSGSGCTSGGCTSGGNATTSSQPSGYESDVDATSTTPQRPQAPSQQVEGLPSDGPVAAGMSNHRVNGRRHIKAALAQYHKQLHAARRSTDGLTSASDSDGSGLITPVRRVRSVDRSEIVRASFVVGRILYLIFSMNVFMTEVTLCWTGITMLIHNAMSFFVVLDVFGVKRVSWWTQIMYLDVDIDRKRQQCSNSAAFFRLNLLQQLKIGQENDRARQQHQQQGTQGQHQQQQQQAPAGQRKATACSGALPCTDSADPLPSLASIAPLTLSAMLSAADGFCVDGCDGSLCTYSLAWASGERWARRTARGYARTARSVASALARVPSRAAGSLRRAERAVLAALLAVGSFSTHAARTATRSLLAVRKPKFGGVYVGS